tara:strand:- start:15686 stop:16249 length:564 start_codon:yes stop_codon:yes gene_type:complete
VSIFVGNLPFRAEREDVLQLFAPYGEVMNCSLPLERDTGRKRGFAFVEMADEALETAAIEALQGAEMMGRPLRINKAEPRSNPPRRNNNRGGYGGSNSGGSYGGSNSGGYGASNSSGGYGGGYGGSNSGGYNDQNQNYSTRGSGTKDWEDRSYGNSVENIEYENGRSRRKRGSGSEIDAQNNDIDNS